MQTIKSNPAVVISLVSAVLTLAGAFGLHLTVDQTAAIVAVVQVVAGFAIRSQVTPVNKQANK